MCRRWCWRATTSSPEGEWTAETVPSVPNGKVKDSARPIPHNLPSLLGSSSLWNHGLDSRLIPTKKGSANPPSSPPTSTDPLKARSQPLLLETLHSSHLTPVKAKVLELPWQSRGEDSALPMQGARVRSPVRELRSHMPHGAAPRPPKKS